jgi:flagellar biosynthetic protein FliO
MKRITAVLAGAVLASLPTVASAQAVGGSVTSFGPADWLALVLRLGLVIGVIWAAVYAMRWYTQRAGGERAGTLRALDIVETRSLGPNRALHVVRVGDRAVVIGVTPERISTLMQIDEPEVLDRLELTAGGSARPAASFGALLAGLGAGPKSARASVEDEAARAEFRGAGAVPTAGLGLTADESVRLAVSEPAWSRGGSSSGARGHSREEVRGASATQDPVPSGHHLRNMTERLLGVLGFTPVESAPDLIARLRAQRIAAQAAMPVAMPTSVASRRSPGGTRAGCSSRRHSLALRSAQGRER